MNTDPPQAPPEPQSPEPLSQQPSPEPIPGTSPVENSDFVAGSQMQPPKPKPDYKKYAIKAGFGLIVLIAVIAILDITNIYPLTTFKAVSYANGEGVTFKLSFYSKHSVKNVFSSAAVAGKANPNLKELVSKVSVGDKYPLALFISTDGSATAAKADDCTLAGLQKSFDTRIDFLGKNVPVCLVQQKGYDVMYIAAFHDSSKEYVATFQQSVDWAKLLSSTTNAQQGLDKIGIDTYSDTVKSILASIKLAN